jgi:hypothetical protein
MNLATHSILLASEDWCKQAASGKVKIYDFRIGRKKGIRSLSPGSVCVVLTKVSNIFYGEFTVTKVKLVDAREYQELASKGLIHEPQQLKPSDKVWVLFFDEFVEYPIKVHKKTLTNVKTATSKKPISEWVITGQSYIDDQALEEIRKIAGKGFESHECIEMKLLELGKMLGFKIYTADSGKKCGDRQLGELTSLSPEELPRNVIREKIDVVWYYKAGAHYKLFEVVLTTDIRTSLTKLSKVSGLNAEFFIVANIDKEREFNDEIRQNPAFSIIRNRTKFVSIDMVNKLYELTKQWMEYAKILNLPYL